MGKRSDFERVPQDRYLTPWDAMRFLAPHLPKAFTFAEPCAADGQLIRWLSALGGTCVAAYDIEPGAPHVGQGNALHILGKHLNGAEMIITNPPWDRPVLHAMIRRFSLLAPTWLLFDADWAFTDQGARFMDAARGRNVIHKIVAVGRLIWIPGTADTGKDNCAWYSIGPPTCAPPQFFARLDGP
jgi:hypothetical protein